MPLIGVLALQGDFAEHVGVLRRIGAEACEVRTPQDLNGVSGLIIPGGESTTISKLMDEWGLRGPLTRLAASGAPVWGTCAGLILLAENVTDGTVPTLGLLDVDVQRNAYGRQVDSFETEVPFPALGWDAVKAVFIRAPIITRVGAAVAVLARLPNGEAIAVKQRNILGSTFHPELTSDTRFHSYFAGLAKEHRKLSNAAAI